ncbi:hypothetical protein NO2_1000 [Candidatus Termititenax persephonae]|uniref:Uncharacterized protein n=1 Tax=Candidatus Termititenax persephonae TaxID=2218525 RepID=A0A388TH48_9BACT|nr:hypothetical protein NO2_1000 [Candidatus Termititenax persephonae]
MTKIIPYAPEYLPAYQDLARRGWGKHCYQQTEKYLRWLYHDNPYADKATPFFIALEPSNNKVIGVLHKLRLPWLIDGQKVIVNSMHNLLVDKDYRQGGGLMLITAALKGETNVFCPGVLPPLSNAYKMLRYQEIDVLWLRQLIWPLGSKTSAAQKLDRPDTAQIAAMVKTLNTSSGNHVLWDAEIFNWRFLRGPKHLFLWADAANFLILSVGQRKGLTVARIIDGHVEDKNSTLWRDALNTARSLGAVVLLGYTADKNLREYFLTKIKPRTRHPLVFFYHRDQKKREMNFNAAAGDFGLESLLNN